MAIFTKTFIRCDSCDGEHELPAGDEEWLRVKVEINTLELDGSAGTERVKRQIDLCPRCFSALQESEFSNLFEPEPRKDSEEDNRVVSLPAPAAD